jgi:hypothetical protein
VIKRKPQFGALVGNLLAPSYSHIMVILLVVLSCNIPTSLGRDNKIFRAVIVDSGGPGVYSTVLDSFSPQKVYNTLTERHSLCFRLGHYGNSLTFSISPVRRAECSS